jgi:hypothetical protein
MFKSKKNSSKSSDHGFFNSKKSKRYEKIPSNPLDEFLDESFVNLEETQNDDFQNADFVAKFSDFITQLKDVDFESIRNNLNKVSHLSRKDRNAQKKIIKKLQAQLDEFDVEDFLEAGIDNDTHSRISCFLLADHFIDPGALGDYFLHPQLIEITQNEQLCSCFSILIYSNQINEQSTSTDDIEQCLQNLGTYFPDLLNKIECLNETLTFLAARNNAGI